MSFLTTIGKIFPAAAGLIDNMHTSEEEKLAAKNSLMVIQAGVVSEVIDRETAELNAKRDIIVAEAKSDGWLTRSWRPMVMLMLTVSIMAYWFGLTPDNPRITEEIVLSMYGLVKIGVGGYVASRGVEKTVPKVIEAFKRREST